MSQGTSLQAKLYRSRMALQQPDSNVEHLDEATNPNVVIGGLRDDYRIEFGDLKQSLRAAKKIASNKSAKVHFKDIDKLVKALGVVISFDKTIDKAYFASDKED